MVFSIVPSLLIFLFLYFIVIIMGNSLRLHSLRDDDVL